VIASLLTVVAHDAGAANHIFAWLGDQNPTLCLEGPARDLWLARLQKVDPSIVRETLLPVGRDILQSLFTESDLTAAMSGAATVITGTGWGSDLEHRARQIARDRGMRSIAVIDHWVNYSDRFVRNGEQVLPDEIWVSDTYAAEIARATFPTVRVIQQPNIYLAELVAEVKSCQLLTPVRASHRVLYVLEPIRHAWGELAENGEFLALDYFMAERQRAGIELDAEIRLRPHPSDPPGKYNEWLNRHDHPRLCLDPSATLSEALGWSNVVVGCQTYAMVIALACGSTVISSIPPWAPTCTLPQLEIIHLSRQALGSSS
jgi:hypothetical protein